MRVDLLFSVDLQDATCGQVERRIEQRQFANFVIPTSGEQMDSMVVSILIANWFQRY